MNRIVKARDYTFASILPFDKIYPKYLKQVKKLLVLCKGRQETIPFVTRCIEQGVERELSGRERPALFQAVCQMGDQLSAQRLLDRGPQVSSQTLALALRGGYSELARILLNSVSSPDLRQVFLDRSLLSIAPVGRPDSKAEVKWLLDHGANIEATDPDGNTPVR